MLYRKLVPCSLKWSVRIHLSSVTFQFLLLSKVIQNLDKPTIRRECAVKNIGKGDQESTLSIARLPGAGTTLSGAGTFGNFLSEWEGEIKGDISSLNNKYK